MIDARIIPGGMLGGSWVDPAPTQSHSPVGGCSPLLRARLGVALTPSAATFLPGEDPPKRDDDGRTRRCPKRPNPDVMRPSVSDMSQNGTGSFNNPTDDRGAGDSSVTRRALSVNCKTETILKSLCSNEPSSGNVYIGSLSSSSVSPPAVFNRCGALYRHPVDGQLNCAASAVSGGTEGLLLLVKQMLP